MNTVKYEKINSLAVAHRGVSGIETENTCAAFVAAGNRSYYGVETDIHRTSDGRFAAIHDGSLKRVGGEDLFVEDNTLDVLRRVVLFDKDGSKDRPDLIVPSLENYIDICKRYGKHCVLELKSDFTDVEIEKIIKIIKERKYLESVTFIAFGYDNLVKVRKLLPSQSVQYLCRDITEEVISKALEGKMDIDAYFKGVTKETVDRLHGLGIKLNCWTVDNKEDAERLDSWGVDYITTNILE